MLIREDSCFSYWSSWRILGAESLVLFISRSHSLALKSLLKWSSNDSFFAQKRSTSENFVILNRTSCHLMTFWWRLESKRTRARGKRNQKITNQAFAENFTCLSQKLVNPLFYLSSYFLLDYRLPGSMSSSYLEDWKVARSEQNIQ